MIGEAVEGDFSLKKCLNEIKKPVVTHDSLNRIEEKHFKKRIADSSFFL